MSWVWLADEDEFKSIWADIGCRIMAIPIDDSVKMTIDTMENRAYGFNWYRVFSLVFDCNIKKFKSFGYAWKVNSSNHVNFLSGI